MNTRQILVEAIFKRADTNQKYVLGEAIKFISDTNLIGLAIDLGIDTDSLFNQAVQS